MHINLVVNPNSKAKSLSNYSTILANYLSNHKHSINIIDLASKTNPVIQSFFRLINVDIRIVLRNTPILKKLPKGIIHFTNPFQVFPLLYQKRKSIVTVHDILPIINKDYSWAQRIFYRVIFEYLKKANLLIADSNFTKECLIKKLGISSEKISVVPLGVDSSQFKILKKVKKEKNRILYVGSEMPRKNLKRLLYAFAELKKKIPDIKLVKIGASQWKNARKKLLVLSKKLDIQNSVFFKNYVNDLTTEYNKSELFVFPSLYEGFGLPILEAMACGCPVVCSNKTSIPEVAGDAALYFDGYDIDDLAEKMFEVLTKRSLKNKLIKKGLERVKKFSWENTAKKTIEVYKEILE